MEIPLEILQSIFCYVVGHNVVLALPGGLVHNPRKSLTSVCSFWRDVALQTPQLWNNIWIDLDSCESLNILTIAVEILSRSRGTPVSIAVTYARAEHGTPAQNLFYQVILPYMKSVKRLDLAVPFYCLRPLLSQPHVMEFPILESLSICLTMGKEIWLSLLSTFKFPRLVTLDLEGSVDYLKAIVSLTTDAARSSTTHLTSFTCKFKIPAETCYQILSDCPMLESCHVHLDSIVDVHTIRPLPELVMAHLEQFHIRYSDRVGFQTFVTRFTLPFIRDLALKGPLGGLGWTPALTEWLITKCGPFLERLFVRRPGTSHPAFSLGRFEVFLGKYAYTLKRLYIPFLFGEEPGLPDSLVHRLVSREMCPNLESLAVAPGGDSLTYLTAIVCGVLRAGGCGRKPVKELHAYTDRMPHSITDEEIEGCLLLAVAFERFDFVSLYDDERKRVEEEDWFWPCY